MKKLLILIALTMMQIGTMRAQTVFYRCIGNNVNVRKGPGVKYGLVKNSGAIKCLTDINNSAKFQLFKGDIVFGDGREMNGFIHIEGTLPWPCMAEDNGWVSKQYLVRAVKCTSCKGKGITNRTCTVCQGMGHMGCHYSGKEPCSKCDGTGYR